MLKKKITKGIAVVTLSLGLVFSGTSATVAPIGTTVTVEAASKNMSVKASNKSVYVGSSAKLNVKATKGAKLSYKTSNKKIATIDNRGNIKGRKAGTAKITITAKKSKYKTVKKTITVKVVKQNQKITASNVSLYYKKGRYLGAKAKTRLTYKSSNSAVVSVNSKGYIVGKKVGTAKIYITAKASGRYKKATKTVVVKVIKQTSTPAVKPTTTPKPTAKPTATPKPTAVPKPTATPMPTATPTATPTPVPLVEPTDVQKAEIDNICSRQYYNPWMYTNNEMCKASSFKFTTDESLSGKGNYCYVESSNTSLICVSTDGVTLYSSAVQPISESNIGKTVTVTFRMGSYTKTCSVEICETQTDWSKVSEEDIAKSIIDRTDYADEVVRLINEYRVSKGLNALKYEERYCLKTAAISAGGSILHACKPDCPNVAATLASHSACQIGWGTTGGGASNTPQKVVQAWIDSPLHNSNILDKRLNSIACAFFINGYRDPRTGSVSEYVSVKCTLSNSTPEEIVTIFDDQADLDNQIVSQMRKYVKNKNDLDKYNNWFFHPKGDVSFPSKTSAQSVGSDDFSVFSDGSETSMDAFASGESVEYAESVTSESEGVGDSIEIEDSLESSTDSSEGFDDSVESIEIESEE
ncbi:CAP domain-containing protein [Blautia intestinalis]|uniref:CAP domain-containing protein n=1 Tax=Blautia intestinalis TaxID=2763028 RepID=UPI0022E0EC22|nr:CAP domain-containing protein [Blautia intestinalis]